MAQSTNQLLEGFSFAGTFLFSQKTDAEGIAAMLGLQGAFPMQTDEGVFWMPGHNYDELMARIYSDWVIPDKATVPQAHPQEPLADFKTFVKKHT
jgi:hypothetical protein